MSEFAGDLPNRRRSKMDKIAVNAFIHGGALSDPIELNHNGGASPRAKDFHSNAHLSCASVAFGP